MNRIEDWEVKKSNGGFWWVYHRHIYKDQQGRNLEQVVDTGRCNVCQMPAPQNIIDMVNLTNQLDGWNLLISKNNSVPTVPTRHYAHSNS